MPPPPADLRPRDRAARRAPAVTDIPIEPQDAFAELARIALVDHDLTAVMETVARLVKRTIAGATDVSVTLVDRGTASTVASTGPLATALDERQYADGRGPCLDSIAAGQHVHIADIATEDRWKDWSADAATQGLTSSLSVPVPVQREVAAAINIYSTEPGDVFDSAAVELALTFAGYAGVALANMHLYQAQALVAEQLQQAMESRATIEQAKGIVMGQRRCGPQEAFDVLVRLSQDTNRKLRDVAQALVEDAAEGSG